MLCFSCLHLFIARFTRSSQAVRMFKTAVDKYLLATPTQSEKENRAKVIQAQATLAKSFARVQLNDSTTWACEADPEAKADADIAALDLAGLNETADKIKRELASTDYFFNTHSASDYFDGLRRVAGYLDVVMRANDFDKVRDHWWAIYQALIPVIPDLSPVTDEQAAPFGLNECKLLPAELTDFTLPSPLRCSLYEVRRGGANV